MVVVVNCFKASSIKKKTENRSVDVRTTRSTMVTTLNERSSTHTQVYLSALLGTPNAQPSTKLEMLAESVDGALEASKIGFKPGSLD